jgi:hypothetical protein
MKLQVTSYPCQLQRVRSNAHWVLLDSLPMATGKHIFKEINVTSSPRQLKHLKRVSEIADGGDTWSFAGGKRIFVCVELANNKHTFMLKNTNKMIKNWWNQSGDNLHTYFCENLSNVSTLNTGGKNIDMTLLWNKEEYGNWSSSHRTVS